VVVGSTDLTNVASRTTPATVDIGLTGIREAVEAMVGRADAGDTGRATRDLADPVQLKALDGTLAVSVVQTARERGTRQAATAAVYIGLAAIHDFVGAVAIDADELGAEACLAIGSNRARCVEPAGVASRTATVHVGLPAILNSVVAACEVTAAAERTVIGQAVCVDHARTELRARRAGLATAVDVRFGTIQA
jgi:hypothetical protein